MRKRSFIYVSEGKDGSIERVNVPMRYVYVFVAAAVVGMFTIAGLAGSYTRMLAKVETINHLRQELAQSRQQYATLQQTAHEKDIQVASLGSLASEVSAIYGLTAGKLTGKSSAKPGTIALESKANLAALTGDVSGDNYYKSVETFVALEHTATEGVPRPGINTSLGVRGSLGLLGDNFGAAPSELAANTPDMWPVMGPINSGFGEREDPILGAGEGEFHKGVDIGAPQGTPVHAPADGTVVMAGMGSGYGREIKIDHGNGISTVYGHLQGFNVGVGQTVVKGQVIGYVGHSGRTTGYHLHYEVQVRGSAVNPHKYLRSTMADLGGSTPGGL